MNKQSLNKILKPYWAENWEPYIRIDDGWANLVYDLHLDIIHEVPDYKLHQIKEKFGVLRYYYELPENIEEETSQLIEQLVNEAEIESTKICQQCGSPEDVQLVAIKQCFRTICDVCLDGYSENDINIRII